MTQPTQFSRSQRRSTLIVFLIFVGLLGVAVVVSITRRTAEQSAQQTAQSQQTPTAAPEPYLFPDVLPTYISRIELQDQGKGKALTLVKIPGDWTGQDGSGAKLKVDLTKMPDLLRILATLRYNRVIESTDLEAFGLSDSGTFAIRFEAGQSYTLYIGKTNPDGTLVYARRGDERSILLVPADSAEVLVGMMDNLAAP